MVFVTFHPVNCTLLFLFLLFLLNEFYLIYSDANLLFKLTVNWI